MKTNRFLFTKPVFVLCVLCMVSVIAAQSTVSEQQARRILEATNIKGGLIVHVGCGDGKLTAALCAGDSYLVQGLDTDVQAVRRAREHIRELGIYGAVSVDIFDGKRLPYADNLVNLVVAEDAGDVAEIELIRVLAPGGILYEKEDGRWSSTVKQRPENIDEWTHFLHDASGNPVAHDEVVGPPRHVQWIAEPRHTRSHEHIPSIYALVSTNGRIFYIADEASVASIRQTPQWYLEARDAFNGIQLWKKPIGTWFPHIVNWGQTPRQLQRKLVAVGNRVYVTLGLHSPLTAVDAATGEILKVYENTRGTEEIVLHKGTLLLVVRSVTDERVNELSQWVQLVRKKSPLDARETAEPLVKRLRATEAKGDKTVLALDADTGRLLWKKDGANVSGLRTLSLCADGDRVFYQNGRDVVSLDLGTGRELWSESSAPMRMVSNDSVFCADGKTVTALSAQTGETQWAKAASLTEIRDLFVAGGSLWVGGFKPFPTKRGPSWGPYFATQRDLTTGEILMHVEPENPSHHHRCYSNKATDRYILGGRRGTEFIDLKSGDVLWHSWARGVCKYGVMPCNGLLYTPPHPCACYVGVKLSGFHALAPERKTGFAVRKSEEGCVERGPAYDKINNSQSSINNNSDWPTYRFDVQRSGSTPVTVPAALRRKWQMKAGRKITAPTIAEGKVFAASIDEHEICAIDADSGRLMWHFTAGARVDSPPTLYHGRVIFGSRDGCVYSLRASDGELDWRLRIARDGRRISVCGQLESASPVLGSVLVRDGVIYSTAGRSSYLDGGIDLYRLEPETGRALSKTPIYSPDPETGKQPPQFAPSSMPGARADILTGDESCIYLRDMVFDKSGAVLPEGKAHLFTLTDFLDDSWPHRSYWIFGKSCSISTGCSGRDRNLIFGRLLVFDESMIYGYGRKQVHWSNQLQDGTYRLFAVKRDDGKAQWTKSLTIHVRAMVLADKVLFVAGPRMETGDGQKDLNESGGAVLMAISTSDGSELARYKLDSTPVFDGMAAAYGRLYVSMENGNLLCMSEK
ncbi:MAG: PQQ-binding-like beta-propeller repeat protein [Planctomycetes bacterium]|nr:PQQ-binding-like beta-propeller repeat protein [Planctomycetota bacterium]